MDEYLRHNIYFIIEGGIEMALTKKQRAFCEEYALNGFNAIQAYLKAFDAGERTANTEGYQLLKKPEVIEYIKELQAERVRRWGDCASVLVQELMDDIVFRDEKGHRSPTWQKSVDLLQKQLGLQSSKVDLKNNMTIKVGLDD